MVTRGIVSDTESANAGQSCPRCSGCALKRNSFQTKAKPSFRDGAPGGRPVWRRVCISVWQQEFGRHTFPKVKYNKPNPGSQKTSSEASKKHRLQRIITMKRITSIALCVLSSIAAVGSASGQDHVAKATVPFGFYVGNNWLPSGTYAMTSDSSKPRRRYHPQRRCQNCVAERCPVRREPIQNRHVGFQEVR